MLTNLAGKLLGGLLHGLLAWAPWLWVVLCAAGAIALLILAPAAFKRWWKSLAVAAVVGFIGLWVWQHFDRFTQLEKRNQELVRQIDEAEGKVQSLQGTITDYTATVERLERRQRQIREEIKTARVGLDSATVIKEAQDDPVKASTDLSDRYNRLNRLFDDATSSFGAATGPGSGTGPDATR